MFFFFFIDQSHLLFSITFSIYITPVNIEHKQLETIIIAFIGTSKLQKMKHGIDEVQHYLEVNTSQE